MRLIVSVVFSLFIVSVYAQDNVNTKKGVAAEGYDVVAYFSDQALKGKDSYSYTYQNVDYRFSSEENLTTFKNNPTKYIPQYGGYCAYAIAIKGEKVGINPKTYQVVDNKLYLFYNSWGVNTLDSWNKEGKEKLKMQADTNWEKIAKEKM